MAPAPVASYVFLDLETTGIPSEEYNRTKITELSLIAVKRDHLLDTRPGATPRVQHKLTLCLNPARLIQPTSTEVTGLCNDLLENETTFNMQVFETINNFINILQKPVCLVAQNGMFFDYPILKNHLERLKMSFSEDLLCADSFHGFYDILEERKKQYLHIIETSSGNGNKTERDSTTAHKESTKEVGAKTEIDECDLSAPNTLPMKLINETTPEQARKNPPVTPSKENNTLSMKLINDTTPKQTNRSPAVRPTIENRNQVSKARRKFPWSKGSKPTEKYKLKDIYERLLNRPAIDAHRAENDCILALECAVVLAKEFVKWVDENCVLFTEINAMKLGVPLGQ